MSILKKIKKKFRGVGRRIGLMDDFNWSNYYEDEYSKQIYDLEKEYTFVIPDGKYAMVNGKIVLDSNILPLHENHKVLYETVYALKPNSLLEVGCGCGDHLANIKKILPEVKLNGSDLSEKQLGFLFSRHPQLKNNANLFIQDLTSPNSKKIDVDLVFTQAVLMHIRRHNFYLNALQNIFSSAEKFVILMERYARNNFVEDIKELSKTKNFPWDNVYFYTNNNNKQKLLIVSAVPLMQFKELKDNKDLLTI